MKSWKTLKLKTKLIVSFLFFGFAPAGIITWISWNSTMDSLRDQAKNQLALIRETKAIEIENLFRTMQGQVKTMANSTMVIDAMKSFAKGYGNYNEEFKTKLSENDMKAAVGDYYKNSFGKEYSNTNNGRTPSNLDDLLGRLNPNALALQYNYISVNQNPLGSKHKLDFANDGTNWSKAHEKFHPALRGFLEEFGYYDIFLVEPKEGNVVYTVYKELDFTTSLLTGSYAQTALGKVFKEARDAANSNYVALSDLEQYFPSYELPAGFIGAPVMDGSTVLGVLVFQIPVEKINAIMTNQSKWKESGYGESGESYLIGSDKKMRSISRFLAEDPEGYFKAVKDILTQDKIDYIRAKKTTAITQAVESKGVLSTLSGQTGFDIYPDYRKVPVLGSYKPLGVKGLNWYILAEIDEAEALNAVQLGRIMLIVLSASLLCIGIFSWYFSSQLASVIAAIIERLKVTTVSTLSSSTRVNTAAQKVSETATEQASAVQEISTTLEELSAMVNKSVDFAGESTRRVALCQDISHEGKEAVTDMSKAMNSITDGNKEIMDEVTASNDRMANIVKVINEISEKTNVINDIVFQTKLLSFNASVEAARAGEHGKGFAVVAEEVGNLAQMSGNAAKDIKSMLNASVTTVQEIVQHSSDGVKRKIASGADKVHLGMKLAKRCGEVLDRIVENVTGVNGMMSDLSAGAKEQSVGIQNISLAMNQIDTSTNINANTANDTLNNAQQLTDQARSLEVIVSELEKEIMGLSAQRSGAEEISDQAPSDSNVRSLKTNSQAHSNSRKPALKKASGSNS